MRKEKGPVSKNLPPFFGSPLRRFLSRNWGDPDRLTIEGE